MPLTFLSTVFSQIVDKLIGGPIILIAKFAWWFYTTFIPFVIKWIGIPMFLLGVLLALSS